MSEPTNWRPPNTPCYPENNHLHINAGSSFKGATNAEEVATPEPDDFYTAYDSHFGWQPKPE